MGLSTMRAMRATLDDTLHFIRSMSSRARELGYILAPYGSTVLNGGGKDVDVFAVPWRPPNDWQALLRLLDQWGYEEVGKRYFGHMGTCAVRLQHRTSGMPIDLQIREVPQTEAVLAQVRSVMELDLAGWH